MFENNAIKIYGISQNPDTKNYIIVLQDRYCKSCGDQYANICYEWCKPCQINNLRENYANLTSGNEKIDNFIQEMQLKIDSYNDMIVEWIQYNQFDNIKEIIKSDFTTVYSATWIDGPLEYVDYEWKRIPYKKVALKCLNNLQSINEFLKEVWNLSWV